MSDTEPPMSEGDIAKQIAKEVCDKIKAKADDAATYWKRVRAGDPKAIGELAERILPYVDGTNDGALDCDNVHELCQGVIASR